MEPITIVCLAFAGILGSLLGFIQVQYSQTCENRPAEIKKLLSDIDELLPSCTDNQIRSRVIDLVTLAKQGLSEECSVLRNSNWGEKEILRATILDIAHCNAQEALRLLSE